MIRFPLFFVGALLLLGTVPGSLCAEEDGDVSVEAEAAVPENVDVIQYQTPVVSGNFYESFDNAEQFNKRWVKSDAHKDGSNEFKYDGQWSLLKAHDRIPDDTALVTGSRAKHHAYSAKLDKPFKFGGSKPFIFQYDVQFRNGQECGGAYVKLLTSSGDLTKLNDKSRYSIMFGPDKCGNDKKVHFIFNHENPKNKTVTEKHWKGFDSFDKDFFSDKEWHQFRLEIYPDNTFKITLDDSETKQGSLLEDFKPPVNPPKMIDDPNDKKPEDWDEREKIPDPEAVKPADWDEDAPRKIPDPKATKPDDWDESLEDLIPDPEAKIPDDWDTEMDGEWEAPKIKNPACEKISGCGKWTAPLIDNPNYKGKWKAPMIANPAYKGKWAPRKIENPDYYEDFKPFSRLFTIDAVFFELWTISDGIAFDNILVTDDKAEAQKLTEASFKLKKSFVEEPEKDNIVTKALRYANENPYMWVVYGLAVLVPLVLFIAFCCVSPRAKDEQDYAKAKKTDQPTQQDVIEEEQEQEPEVEDEPVIEEVTDEKEVDGGDVQTPTSVRRRARKE